VSSWSQGIFRASHFSDKNTHASSPPRIRTASVYRSKSSDDSDFDMSLRRKSASLPAKQPPQLLPTTIQRPRAGGIGPTNGDPKQRTHSQASAEEVSPSEIFELSKLPPEIRKIMYNTESSSQSPTTDRSLLLSHEIFELPCVTDLTSIPRFSRAIIGNNTFSSGTRTKKILMRTFRWSWFDPFDT
jgi:hypothetical protein